MAAFFDKLYGNNRLAVLFFAGLSALFSIGLGHLHLFDWDEINFAESAREMIKSGDYLRVQINYTAFWEKPPFFFWLQVACMKIFGINEFAARFPNAVFGFLYLITLYFIGKRHFSARFGMIWALIFTGTLLPHIYFNSGIIDPVFNYFIFLSVYFMIRVIGKDEHSGKLAVYSGIFSSLSVLTKGPVGFLLLGATLFVYLVLRRFKPFPKVKYILLFLAGFLLMVSAWVAIELLNNGTENLQKFIVYQLELFNSDVAGHAQPFYYHFVVVFLGCFPISVLALPSFRVRENSPFDFHTWMLILFWVVMIVFSITTTKIIHYSSMTYVPLAFLAALTLERNLQKGNLHKALRIGVLVHGLIIGTGLLLVPYLLSQKSWLISQMKDPYAVASMGTSLDISPLAYFAGILFLAGVIFGFYLLIKDKFMSFLAVNLMALSLSLLIVLFMVLPQIERITQGPAISMYQDLAGKEVYVESFGFKSYAQYFYFDAPPGRSQESKDMTWLLTGDIDKPVYLISKADNHELDTYPGFQFIRASGGFRLYLRDIQE